MVPRLPPRSKKDVTSYTRLVKAMMTILCVALILSISPSGDCEMSTPLWDPLTGRPKDPPQAAGEIVDHRPSRYSLQHSCSELDYKLTAQ